MTFCFITESHPDYILLQYIRVTGAPVLFLLLFCHSGKTREREPVLSVFPHMLLIQLTHTLSLQVCTCSLSVCPYVGLCEHERIFRYACRSWSTLFGVRCLSQSYCRLISCFYSHHCLWFGFCLFSHPMTKPTTKPVLLPVVVAVNGWMGPWRHLVILRFVRSESSVCYYSIEQVRAV